MTDKKKQELRQLLNEAMKSLEIRYGSKPVSIPVDLYGRYLEERWTSYGVDFLSFRSSPRFTLEVVDEAKKSKLRDFIREELSQFVNKNDILIGRYLIEDASLYYFADYRVHQHRLIERLLEIAIVRGIKESVLVFDRCNCPEGAHGVFQHVTLLGGIKLRTKIEVFEGVQLVPPPPSEISEELVEYLPGFPRDAYVNPANSFFEKTLLVIDRPGFSIFHKPSPDPTFPWGLPVDKLPFQVKVHDVKFLNLAKVHFFRKLFCQALSLVCDSPVQIIDGEKFFFEADKSFNPYDSTINMLRHSDLLRSFTEVEEIDIEKAKRLYDILDKNSDVREKLQIPIDRWRQSKTDKKPIDEITDDKSIDEIIDLGIALEAFYVTSGKITKQLCHRAPWYLGENEEKREELKTEFKAIYDYRSDIVHNRELNETVQVGEQFVAASELVARAQDLCRTSIMKVLDDGKFPNWTTLRQDMTRNR